MIDTSFFRSLKHWLPMLWRYLAVMLPGNLVWEVAHLPLYTLWTIGSAGEKVFAVAHCTAGDMLIAAISLLCALLITGDARWPKTGFARVAGLTVAFGIGYTVLSEWLNTVVRESWAYAAAMPTVPVLGTGVSPLLQWVVVPCAAFWLMRRRVSAA